MCLHTPPYTTNAFGSPPPVCECVQGDCTALHVAALEGRAHCLALLLSAGADIEARDHDHKTALHVAAESGKWGCVTELLRRGADINAESHVRSPTQVTSVVRL